MRTFLLCLMLAVAGCSNPTEPATPWQDAEWFAISANGRPLPYTTLTGVRVDSLRIRFTTTQPLDQFREWSYAGSTSDGTTTRVTAIDARDNGIRVLPQAPPFSLRARTVGARLHVDDFAGADWELVRR